MGRISLGLFTGRSETVYMPVQKQPTITTAFVLQGAFEPEGRLLHKADALSVYNAPTLEMEALSNQAILLLIETMPVKIKTTNYLY